MLLFTSLLITLLAIAIVLVISTIIGGSIILVIFGDLIVFVGLMWFIFKFLIKRD